MASICTGMETSIKWEPWVQREYHQRGAAGATGIPSEGSSGCNGDTRWMVLRVALPSPHLLSPHVTHLQLAEFHLAAPHTRTQHPRQLRSTTDMPQQLHLMPLESWLIDDGCNALVPFLDSSFLLDIKSCVRSME
jgi:hypothetical protein